MDKEKVPLVFRIALLLLLSPCLLFISLLVLDSLIHQFAAAPYTILDSNSPSGSSHILVEGKAPNDFLCKGPTDVTIHGETIPFSFFESKSKKMHIKIENIGDDICEGKTAWLFWVTDSEAVIVLLGRAQVPTVICVTFGDKVTFTQQQSSELAREILERHQVDTEEIPEELW